MRKVTVLFVLVLALCVLFTACTGEPTGTGTTTTAAGTVTTTVANTETTTVGDTVTTTVGDTVTTTAGGTDSTTVATQGTTKPVQTVTTTTAYSPYGDNDLDVSIWD